MFVYCLIQTLFKIQTSNVIGVSVYQLKWKLKNIIPFIKIIGGEKREN